MRGFIPDFELVTPKNLSEAISLFAKNKGALRPFAGGTDLMVLLESGVLPAGKYLNLLGLKELIGIKASKHTLKLGALTTFSDIRDHAKIQLLWPNLCRAAAETGAVAIQNRGTLGGNIANASPAADTPPALLAYDASIELTSSDGKRWIQYDGFHSGYKKTLMEPGEIISAIEVPNKFSGWKHYFRKVGSRKAQAISKVVMAGAVKLKAKKIEEIRLAVGSVAPTALRLKKTENFLTGKKLDSTTVVAAMTILKGEISPIDDIRSNQVYRRTVCAYLLEDFLLGYC